MGKELRYPAIAGTFFLTVLLGIAVVATKPTPLLVLVVRVILALGSAAFGATIPGLLRVKLGVGKTLVIQAAGAIAIFVTVYLLNPPVLPGSEDSGAPERGPPKVSLVTSLFSD